MRCRVCRTPTIPWLDLGKQPLANGFWQDAPPPAFPLEVERCPSCALSQLSVIVDPELLYTNYVYQSGVSNTFRKHCGDLAAQLSAWVGVGTRGRVLDIASNDGTLLESLGYFGFIPVGVEPCRTLAEQSGYPVTVGFFPDAAKEYPDGYFQYITALNVLGHVNDVHAFVEEAVRLLAPGGSWVVEVPWVRSLLRDGAFDTIYHEHLSYWSLTALNRLAERHGLWPTSTTFHPIHGGTVRVRFQKTDPKYQPWGEDELFHDATYKRFETTMNKRVKDFWNLYEGSSGTWAAFGAAAKGTVFATKVGLGPKQLSYVVDETPAKQGLKTPYNVRVVPLATFTTRPVDHCLILPWNFAEEIRPKIPAGIKVVVA